MNNLTSALSWHRQERCAGVHVSGVGQPLSGKAAAKVRLTGGGTKADDIECPDGVHQTRNHTRNELNAAGAPACSGVP